MRQSTKKPDKCRRKREKERFKVYPQRYHNNNKTYSSIQGAPYVLGQAILPFNQYQIGILYCSWTQMKDLLLYQKIFIKNGLEKSFSHVILISTLSLLFSLCAAHILLPFLFTEGATLRILTSIFHFFLGFFSSLKINCYFCTFKKTQCRKSKLSNCEKIFTPALHIKAENS